MTREEIEATVRAYDALLEDACDLAFEHQDILTAPGHFGRFNRPYEENAVRLDVANGVVTLHYLHDDFWTSFSFDAKFLAAQGEEREALLSVARAEHAAYDQRQREQREAKAALERRVIFEQLRAEFEASPPR